jgi:thiamine-phosphate pyrophosphorylase
MPRPGAAVWLQHHPLLSAAAVLYAIVDAQTLKGRDIPGFAAACLRGGAQRLQWRAKDLPDDEALDVGRQLASLCAAHGSTLVMNDRADLAALLGADLHVGQDDLPVPLARAQLRSGARVGLSTHSVAQVEAAHAVMPDSLGFGPVFASGTKQGHAAVTGLHALEAAVKAARGIPVVAIGGITLETAPACIRAGATYVAVIGALAAAADVESTARDFTRACQRAAGERR